MRVWESVEVFRLEVHRFYWVRLVLVQFWGEEEAVAECLAAGPLAVAEEDLTVEVLSVAGMELVRAIHHTDKERIERSRGAEGGSASPSVRECRAQEWRC